MQKILIALSAMAALVVPTASFAATYFYVDTGGTVRSVEASSANEALATAPNRAATSGVTLDMGVLDDGDSVVAPGIPNTGSGSVTYHYVTNANVVESVEADTPSEAFSAATNISMHSGVALDQGLLDDGVTVENQ